MGAYTTFNANFFSIELKWSYNYNLMSVFLPSSLKCIEENEGDDNWRRYIYEMSAKEYKNRLDLMGFTLQNARKSFDLMFDFNRYFNDLDEELHPKEVTDWFEFFINCFEKYFNEEMPYDNEDEENLLMYMFENDYSVEGISGFPVSDIRFLATIALRDIKEDYAVFYEISEIVEGWEISEIDFVEHSRAILDSGSQLYNKIIVITEGSSDVAILQKGLEFLYPDKKEFFAFFDYKKENLPGSTSEIIKIVKTFITANIGNRIFVLFDNDDAGIKEFNTFKSLSLPNNVQGSCYPDLDLANSYPVIGLDGVVSMQNINSKGVSIELFLGAECLSDDAGNLIPAKMRVRSQQITIECKEQIKKKFYKKYKETPELIDWKHLERIFEILFNAFR